MRDLTGVLLLDKPAGATSNAVLQRVRHFYQAKKAGHTGSLDPSATGLLPICFGEATKLCGYLLESNKTYVVDAVLGVTTDTEDADGTVTATCDVPPLELATLSQLVASFQGPQMQKPPIYSALKRNGVRAYKLAREGLEVELEPRAVVVHEITLDPECFTGTEFRLTMCVSKGTYVRSIVRDIGEKLGCGAHVKTLRRTAVSPFVNEKLVTMQELEQAENPETFLHKADRVVANRASIQLDAETASRFCHGAKPMLQNLAGVTVLAAENEVLRVYDDAERFLGLGDVRDGKLHTVRLLAS